MTGPAVDSVHTRGWVWDCGLPVRSVTQAYAPETRAGSRRSTPMP